MFAGAPPYAFAEPDEILAEYEFEEAEPSFQSLKKNAKLDDIGNVAGRARATELRDMCYELLGQHARRALDFLAGDLQVQVKTSAEAKERAASIRANVSNFMAARINDLVRGGILEEHHDLTESKIIALCGLFAVEKVGKFDARTGQQLARIIFDARRANAMLEPLGISLVLFTLDTLLEAAGLFCGRGFGFTTDMRHYYYQWRIAGLLALSLVVTLRERDPVTAEEKIRYFLPRVLAMGYRDACALAQAASWALAIFRYPHEDTLNLDPEVLRAEVPPRHVWLREDGRRVGVLFVLLDGYLILTDDKKLRDAWRHRIERNLELFNIAVKPGASVSADSDTSSPSGELIEFAGVRLRFGGPTQQSSQQAEVQPVRSGAAVINPRDARTRRDHASLAGSLLWTLRVRNADPADFFQVLTYARWLSDAASTEPSGSTSTDKEFWREPLIWEPSRRKVLEGIRKRYVNKAFSVPCVRPTCMYTNTIFAATDATPTTGAFVIFNAEACRRRDAANAVCHFRIFDHEESHQVWSEADAVGSLADDLPQVRETTTLVLVAVDADPVTVAVNKGYSISARMAQAVRRTRANPGHVRFIATRIAGNKNFADLPSRHEDPMQALRRPKVDADHLQRLWSTWEVLQALQEATR